MKRSFLYAILFVLFFCIPIISFAEDTLTEESDSVVIIEENGFGCIDKYPEGSQLDAKFIGSMYKAKLNPGEIFDVKIYLLNTGNVTWYGDKSECNKMPFFRLGTSKVLDRQSELFRNVFNYNTYSADEPLRHNWLSGNRIHMKQAFVPPGQVATFEFKAIAPYQDDVYMEYFSPLFENLYWLDDISIALQLHVGDVTEEMRAKSKYLTFSGYSRLLDPTKKNITIDVSEQKMYVRMGDFIIYEFPVSTGTFKTPTPIGNTQIFFKQWVRVAAKAPHYIMPRYLSLRSNGAYGIHALPSLGNDGGVFWREALNHIGTRRSHGCIRVLPDDAETLWEFTDDGIPVEIIK